MPLNSFVMSKKPAKKPVLTNKKAAVERKPFPRKYIYIALGVIALGIAAWKFWPQDSSEFRPGEMHGVEPTITAEHPLLQLLDAGETGIDFQNLIVETKTNNFATNINIYNGGGVAIADVNNDNLPDIYFICTNGQNRLYLNQGNFKFKDITESAGLKSEEGFETAVAAVDINADGFLDFYVCRAGPFENDERRNKLYINNGNLTFTERSKEYGLDDMSASTGAAFFDGDGDGYLDLYVLNYPKESGYATKIDVTRDINGNPVPNFEPKDPFDSDRYYHNDGNGKFSDVSQKVGIWNRRFGLSVSVGDINRDGSPDIYAANDFYQPDLMYINNGNGTFNDRLSQYVRHTTQFSMGSDLSDFDNDGLIDIFTVDMMPANNYRHKTLKIANTNSLYQSMVQNGIFEPVTHNVLQHNNGNGTFSDIACEAGVFRTDWSWSGLVFDLDNDGMRDIYVSNGYRREIHHIDNAEFLKDVKQKKGAQEILQQYKTFDDYLNSMPAYKIRDFIFQNKGAWKFDEKSGDWATMKATWSCGAAWTDLDADGDLDLVVNNLEDPAFLFKNLSREQNKGNYLQAKLHGSPQNPFAVGASVLIEYNNGQKQYQELNPNRGIFSCSEHLIHFGIGNVNQVDKLSVRWPDGKVQVLTSVPVNQRLQLDWKNASGKVASLIPPASGNTLFADKVAASGINFVHKESRFNDFENYPLMTWMESELGPFIAKGDVNGDGLEDFYVGNSQNAAGAMYIQTPDGAFKPVSQSVWESDKAFEDQGAVLFDADGDNDLDLFVVSGGFDVQASARAQLWQHRLYLNDGKGGFSRAASAIPALNTDIGMRVTAFDYDGDKDLDLFIGGRLVPDKWPLTPRSLVLRNDGGKFSDVTDQVGGDFTQCGMVTDLNWTDLDKDGQAELVVVGEWMPVSIFKLNGGKLTNATSQYGLDKSNGLWFCVRSADLDGDGDQDLVTGNFGVNTRFTTSAEGPFSCYAKDFDNNGTIDPIVTMFEGNKSFPVLQKEVMVKQMPSMKKKYLYAENYAKADIEKMWGGDLNSALHLMAYDFETCWWENQGGKFVRHALPYEVQASAIQGIVVDDLNGDGHPDLLMAGNKYGMEVGAGRYDAGNGVFLAGDGKGNFNWINNLESGFWATRDARDVKVLKGAGTQRTVLVANNNSFLQVFR